MIINNSNLNALRLGFQRNFMKSYLGTKSVWPQLAMATTSSLAEEGYPFLEEVGLMKEYVSELNTEQLVAYMYKLKNRKFGKSYAVKVEDIERDNLKLLPTKAEAFGRAMMLWGDQLLGEQFKAMFDGGPDGDNLDYAGAFFCDTSHPVVLPGGSIGTASNKITKKLDFSTFAAAQASFGAAKDLFQSRVDKDGEPLMLKPDTLVVGNDLEDTANAGMTLERLEDGKPNIYRNKCKVLKFDWVKSGEWFLLDTSSPFKPFIFQTEKKPYVLPMPDETSEQVRKKEIVDFVVKARGAAGFGEWRLCVGSDGTT